MLSLPREGLINLAVALPAPTASPNDSSDHHHSNRETSEGASSLEGSEHVGERDFKPQEGMWLESESHNTPDDPNELITSNVGQAPSFADVSSINSAIPQTVPVTRSLLPPAVEGPGQPHTTSTLPVDEGFAPAYFPLELGQDFVDSYFSHMHVSMPTIDEEQFQAYMAAQPSERLSMPDTQHGSDSGSWHPGGADNGR